MKNLLINLFLISTIVKVQNFKVGFDAETNNLWHNNSESTYSSSSFVPTSFHISLCFIPIDKLSLYAKIGGSVFLEKFSGNEYGFSGKYYFYEPFYLNAGYLYHYNSGRSEGNSSGPSYASIHLIQAGTGVKSASFLSIEINFYTPTQ